MPHIVIFLLGAGAAALFKIVGGPILRPVVKTAVKTGIVLGRKAQEFAAEVTEDLQDVAAEASAEVGGGPKKAAAKAKG
jgi:hypothetical protein